MAYLVSQGAKFGLNLLLEDARYRSGVSRQPSRIEYIRRAGPTLKRVAAGLAGYVAAKRLKMSLDQFMAEGTATQNYGGKKRVNAGALSVVQRGYAKSKYGKRPTKKAKLCYKLLNSTLGSAIARWQRVGSYENFTNCHRPRDSTDTVGGAIALGHFNYPVSTPPLPGEDLNTYYPCVIFDLTSLNAQIGGNSLVGGDVCYQLYRDSGGRYDWQPQRQYVDGFTPTAVVGQGTWLYERINGFGGFTPDARITISKNVYMSWADIRMNLYGPKAHATKFYVSLVQFKDRAWDPEVERFQSPSVDNMRSESEQGQMDAAFDEFMKPLVYNPMVSAGKSSNQLFNVLTMRKYVINPDLSSNFDASQPNINLKVFHNLNRVCKYDWVDSNLRPSGDTTLHIATDAVLETDRFNQQLRKNASSYVHPRAKVFLMVHCEAFVKELFSQSEGTNGGDPAPTEGLLNCPGFDIVIRKKVMFDDI